MKTKILLVLCMFMILAAIQSAYAAIDGAFVNKTGATWGFVPNVYFIDAAATGYSYMDSYSPDNPSDIGIAACGINDNSKYLTAAYAANVSGTWTYVSISYDNTNQKSYAAADQSINSLCTNGYASQPSNFGIASSTHGDYDPAVYIAAFPGYLYLLVNDANSGSPDIVYPFNNSRGIFAGSYSSVTTNYSQSTHNVTIDFSNIVFNKYDSSTLTKSKSDATYGITSSRRIVIAACTDSYGMNCSAASVISSSGSLPVSLATDITSPADTAKYTRYAVINGIGTSYCIGPSLGITSVSISPGSVLPGQNVTITATVSNSGNVNVSQNFVIAFYKDSISAANNFANSTAVSGLVAGSSTSKSATFNTTGLSSGTKTIYAKVLDKDATVGTIEDCSSSDDSSSSTYTVTKGYYLNVYVNNVQTDNFDAPGKPYNMTVYVFDTDGGDTSGLTLKVTEKNGMNLFAPMQGYTISGTKYGGVPYSIIQFTTNSSGAASFALMPTGNKLYLPEYSYLNISDYVGNYSLYIELYSGSTRLQVSQAGYGTANWHTLNLSSHTPVQPSAAEENTIYVINNNQYVQQIISLFNQAYSGVYKWLGTV